MDTLFRLVSLQSSDQQSYNSSRTSSSSRSSSKPNTNNISSNISSNNNNNNNNNNNSSSNNNNNNNNNNCNYYHYYYHHQAGIVDAYQQEECGNAPHFYMDEDFSSSSSSKQFHQAYNPQNPSATTAATTTTATTTASAPAPSTSSTAHLLFDPAEFSSLPPDLNLDFSSPTTSASGGGGGGGGRWAAQLLTECARAVAARDSGRVQQLMWMLNELSSAYGDPEQKIAAYFLQGLFARLTASGPRTLRTLSSAADRAASFESTRRTALRFQELSPWSSFGHVAANGAILEAFLEGGGGAQRLHILDLSSTTFCTQWPTLLEALATRSADDTPHLTITTVVPPALQRVMREIGQRMDKFARLMGVPFRFAAVHPPAAGSGSLADLDLDALDLRAGDGAALLAVNCVGALRGVPPAPPRRRDAFLAAIRRLEPRIVTVVEEEADLAWAGVGGEAAPSSSAAAAEDGGEFVRVFTDALRFFSAYMDALEESFPRTSNERLALERAAGRAVVDVVACPAEESAERRERAAAWSRRMRAAGFAPAAFSDDVADDVRSLLRRYREGWSMKDDDDAGVFLAWKDQPVVWASAWRPSPSSS